MGLTKQYWEQEQKEERDLMENYVLAFRDKYAQEIKHKEPEIYYNLLLQQLIDEFCLESISDELEDQIYSWFTDGN